MKHRAKRVLELKLPNQQVQICMRHAAGKIDLILTSPVTIDVVHPITPRRQRRPDANHQETETRFDSLLKEKDLLELYLHDTQNGVEPDETEIEFNMRGQLYRSRGAMGGYVVIFHIPDLGQQGSAESFPARCDAELFRLLKVSCLQAFHIDFIRP